MTPLDEWLALRKGLFRDRAAQDAKKSIHAPSGIRNSSNQVAKIYALGRAATGTGLNNTHTLTYCNVYLKGNDG
jgi:hypothetical protein